MSFKVVFQELSGSNEAEGLKLFEMDTFCAMKKEILLLMSQKSFRKSGSNS